MEKLKKLKYTQAQNFSLISVHRTKCRRNPSRNFAICLRMKDLNHSQVFLGETFGNHNF